eukprot:7104881-Prymnesium_polylepis.1
MLLTEAGVVYSFGCGDCGPLGHNNQDGQQVPKGIEALHGVKVSAIAAGCMTSLAVAAHGAAYGWGCGEDASLIHEHQLTPMQYPTTQLHVRG